MDALNLKEILKIVDSWKQNDPVKQFIKENGFDPDAGDILILPSDFELKIEHPNVKYSQFISCAALLKKPDLVEPDRFNAIAPRYLLMAKLISMVKQHNISAEVLLDVLKNLKSEK